MNDAVETSHRVLRIVLKDGFIWYDVMVDDDFNFRDFVQICINVGNVYFSSDEIQLYAPLSELKSMFVFRATKQTKLNVVNFPGQPCEPPKAG